MRRLGFQGACLLAALVLIGPASGVALGADKPFVVPAHGAIIRDFEAPAHRFGPGHRGIDYGVPSGTPVVASGAGSVSFAGSVAGDGLFVTIEHLGGITTTYSYLSRIDVAQGVQVTQGQVIGLSGDGHEGGPAALHFGAKQNGEYIDPKLLLSDFDDISDLISLAPVQRSGGSSGLGGSASLRGSGAIPAGPAALQPSGALPREVPPNLTKPAGTNAAGGSQAVGGLAVPAGPSGAGLAVPDPPDASTSANDDVRRPSVAPPAGPRAKPRVPETAEWRALPQEVRRDWLLEDPDRWADYEGLSAAEKDWLNRERLKREIEKLKRDRASKAGSRSLRNHTALTGARGAVNPLSIASKFDRESELDRKIRSAEALLDQLEKRDASGTKAYLLDFDTDFAGGDGKAAVALGDPDTADHIGVLVPGTNNAVGSNDRPLRDAERLRSEVGRSVDPQLMERTSTIVWMGYDNPNGVQDAVNRGEANDASPWLKSFVNDLQSRHVGGTDKPHITVLGHSYGSTVTGLAALQGMKADDIVFLGSPGVGRHFVDAKDFKQERIWAARTRRDFIAPVAGVLGSDPMDKWFGSRHIPLGPEQKDHSDYFAPESKGLINLAKILTARRDEVL